MFVFVVLVPALLVVLLGYAVGFALWGAIGSPLVHPEAAGWVIGLALLGVVVLVLRHWRRGLRRVRRRDGR